jgi:hypothetical protein
MSSGDYEAAKYGINHCIGCGIPDNEGIEDGYERGCFYLVEHDRHMGEELVAKMLSTGILALPTMTVGRPSDLIAQGFRISKMVREGN